MENFDWLVRTGETAALIRTLDWTQSPIGTPASWPQSLRSAINLCLASKTPMYVWWGPENVNIYNDAYIPLAGRVRHQKFFGKPAREMWPEVWDKMQEYLEQIYRTGQSIEHGDLLFVLDRNGSKENCYFSFSFNPAFDEGGKINGAFAVVIETTERVLAEQKLAQEIRLRELAAKEVGRSQQQLQIIADFSPALIAHVDQNERYQFMNSLYEDWFGFNPVDSLGKTILEVVGKTAYDKAKAPIQDAIAGKHVQFENPVSMKNGNTKYVDLHFVPLNDRLSEFGGFIILGYDITERKAAEAALRASEARYREAQEQLAFALESARMKSWHLDLKTNQVFTNFGSPPITGYEISQRNLEEMVKVKVHPEDAEDTFRALTHSIENHKPYDHEYRQIQSDGSHRWIGARGMPRYDQNGVPLSIAGVMLDITDKKQSADLYRAITELTPQFVWMSDENGAITFSNSTLLNYMGVPNAETLGNRWLEMLHPDDRENTLAIWRNSVATGKPYEIEFRIRSKEGDYGWFLSRALPMREKATGRIDRWLGVSTDITASKTAQEEVAKTVQDLLQERDIREKFVATLSHDLRTPLTSAKMGANLLARKTNDPEYIQKLSGRIADSIDRADQMIRDLLDANLIRAGEKLPVEVVPCDLVQIASDTLDELCSLHGDRFALSTPKEILGFWSLSGVRRILENLCSNAIKYGDSNRVEVSLTQNNHWVNISVHNQGPAINEEDQATLFDPFKRTLLAKTGKQKGWGLGLTLVKGIAESHGGKVSVESTSENGTTFLISLPVDARDS